eukprot:m.186538 g.186538  ORF g.186538 m.186538 type:complete len:161 (+) comp53563_c0_seq1:1684-2166(+)
MTISNTCGADPDRKLPQTPQARRKRHVAVAGNISLCSDANAQTATTAAHHPPPQTNTSKTNGKGRLGAKACGQLHPSEHLQSDLKRIDPLVEELLLHPPTTAREQIFWPPRPRRVEECSASPSEDCKEERVLMHRFSLASDRILGGGALALLACIPIPTT